MMLLKVTYPCRFYMHVLEEDLYLIYLSLQANCHLKKSAGHNEGMKNYLHVAASMQRVKLVDSFFLFFGIMGFIVEH